MFRRIQVNRVFPAAGFFRCLALIRRAPPDPLSARVVDPDRHALCATSCHSRCTAPRWLSFLLVSPCLPSPLSRDSMLLGCGVAASDTLASTMSCVSSRNSTHMSSRLAYVTTWFRVSMFCTPRCAGAASDGSAAAAPCWTCTLGPVCHACCR